MDDIKVQISQTQMVMAKSMCIHESCSVSLSPRHATAACPRSEAAVVYTINSGHISHNCSLPESLLNLAAYVWNAQPKQKIRRVKKEFLKVRNFENSALRVTKSQCLHQISLSASLSNGIYKLWLW